MHSVSRSPEPDFWRGLNANFLNWDDLGSRQRSQIRDALARDFGPICAYCERPCTQPTLAANTPDEETVDHFRPRDRFPTLAFDWLNLVYACHRCNQRKDNQWPGFDDDIVNQVLAAAYPGTYITPGEYVNPNAMNGRRPAREFFMYDFDTGDMLPAEVLDQTEWSTAIRTIRDIDLNDCADDAPGENDLSHLWNRRKAQLDLLISQLSQKDDIGEIFSVIQQFTMPDKPFSGFIAAWVKERFGTLPTD